ncbi:ATP synthase delta chain [Morus notabilis]|uniref:ATP synthase delta chain n=1 Tax=Morus notabilis TaxID=981085 RepID=W9RLH4_9ROSA|nr:ATP synthase delta chain, chloroplastic [Morus notabilis]EXB83857.1 ATP synthase delta chain [Morus notabilis]
MDPLSSSVSTLKVPTLHSTTSRHELLTHFKTTPSKNLPYSSLLPNKTPTFTTQNPFTPSSFSSTSPTRSLTAPSPSPRPPIHHRNPATGYAAALLDVAQANNSVDSVGRDVERLLNLMRNKRVEAVLGSAFVGEKEKGQVVKDLAEKGRFSRHLVRLVKMLVDKKKDVGIIRQVLEEFERVYDQMLRTQVVLVSSAKKIEENNMFWIAKRVQTLTGALKVKVRNLVRHNSLSFAV